MLTPWTDSIVGPALMAPSDRPSPALSDKPRILIIEDDVLIADMYRLQLSMDGFEVTVAGDGDSGLSALASGRHHVVLLDIGLPGHDGFTVLAEMRRRPEGHPPVLILSNYGDPELVNRGLTLGATAYLIKSQTPPHALSARVWEVVRGPVHD